MSNFAEETETGHDFGTEHSLDLILCRGQGKCDIDWSKPESVKEWETRYSFIFILCYLVSIGTYVMTISTSCCTAGENSSERIVHISQSATGQFSATK